MNIFLPYEDDIVMSVQSLDDLRLKKQILECYQLLQMTLAEMRGEEVKGYAHHPIYVHYKQYPWFLMQYGLTCCQEYEHRFDTKHQYYEYFLSKMRIHQYENKGKQYFIIKVMEIIPIFVPFYMQGQKGKPDCIRTTDNVSELYQNRLCEKWDTDVKNGRPPKWTNRERPSFWKGEII